MGTRFRRCDVTGRPLVERIRTDLHSALRAAESMDELALDVDITVEYVVPIVTAQPVQRQWRVTGWGRLNSADARIALDEVAS